MANKPRGLSVDDIQPLPKRLYRRVYGDNFDESTWKLRISELSEGEKEALEPILKTNKLASIYRVPEVQYPSGISTPDVLIDGVKIEIKTPTKLNAEKASDIMRKANKQTQGGVFLLNASNLTDTTDEQVQSIVKKAASRRGGKGIVVRNGGVLFGYIKKENTETAVRQGVHNPGFSSVSILTNKLDIVNLIKGDPAPKLRKQTRSYWERRSIERTLQAERDSLLYLRQTRRVYAASARAVTKQVRDIYATYYRDNGFDVQALRELAPQGDVRRLKARMRKLGLETNLPDNYAARVNRLELLNLQMRAEAYEAGQRIKALTGKSLSQAYKTGYYRTLYDTAKGIGHTPAFSQLSSSAIESVLSAKFYGKNYSERIWGRSKKLGDELQQIIGQAVTMGQSHDKTARLIRERFDVSSSAATRLIRTEVNYFENQAELEAYREMGVEEYQFVATIDIRTSEVCQGHDHKIYKVKDAKVGINMPPLHPNCRSTVVAYFGKEWAPDVRIARNPGTGRNEYVTNMSYGEWKQSFVSSVAYDRDASSLENMIIMGGGVRYDAIRMAGVDRTLLEESSDQLSSIIMDYPDLQRSIQDNGGLELTSGHSSKSRAATYRDNSKIVLYDIFKNRRAYIESLEKEIASGFKMKVPKDKIPLYTITHEAGHVIENFLMGSDVNNESLARRIKNDILTAAQQISDKKRPDIEAQMSKYGMTNPREFFAEAFVAYRLGNRSDIARGMGEFLKERLNSGH